MINYINALTKEDLLGILYLQKRNLANSLTKKEAETEGFLTVRHNYKALKSLNDIEKHIVAKDNITIVGYLLAMTNQLKLALPILTPMFNLFDNILFANRTISTYTYIVVGQVCISKNYRGQGILDTCYAAYKAYFVTKYDFAITEIASTNLRSLKAHKRIGFEEIDVYLSPDGTEWRIVLWDWNNIDKSFLNKSG
jgi:hypothetical protein